MEIGHNGDVQNNLAFAGHNVYRNIGHGIVIIKVAGQIAKFRL